VKKDGPNVDIKTYSFLTTTFTRTKRRWAEEGRFLTGRTARPESEHLPPGQAPCP
jgi:hypothetical protein